MPPINPAPTTSEAVLNPDWLTAALYKGFDGVNVAKVSVVERLATTATKLRIAVELDGAEDNLPTTFCIKAMLDEIGAPFVGADMARTETLFYREAAPLFVETGLRVPRCHYTGIDPANGQGLFIMEDIVVRSGQFLSALTPYSVQDASSSLTELAKLHASSWNMPNAAHFPWIKPTLQKIAVQSFVSLDRVQELMSDPRADSLPDHVRNAAALHAAIKATAGRFAKDPACVIHGDAHAGNLYRKDDAIGLIDWQLVQSGNWAQDVAYHLGAALDIETRRTQERTLLAHYFEMLRQFGGPAIDPDQGWERYRLGMLYGYYLWSITQRVAPDIIREFVSRLGQAVVDLESFELASSDSD